jgi:hypothetical protein
MARPGDKAQGRRPFCPQIGCPHRAPPQIRNLDHAVVILTAGKCPGGQDPACGFWGDDRSPGLSTRQSHPCPHVAESPSATRTCGSATMKRPSWKGAPPEHMVRRKSCETQGRFVAPLPCRSCRRGILSPTRSRGPHPCRRIPDAGRSRFRPATDCIDYKDLSATDSADFTERFQSHACVISATEKHPGARDSACGFGINKINAG